MPEGSIKPGPVGCDPGCLNCRGGKSNYYRAEDDGYTCLLCGGMPYPCTRIEAVAHSKIAEGKALLKLYGLQLATRDEMRSLTLAKLRALVSALEALDRGQARIGPAWSSPQSSTPDPAEEPEAIPASEDP